MAHETLVDARLGLSRYGLRDHTKVHHEMTGRRAVALHALGGSW